MISKTILKNTNLTWLDWCCKWSHFQKHFFKTEQAYSMSKEVQEKEFSVKRRRRLPENGRRLATHSWITMSHRKRTSATSSLITPSLHIKQLTIHLLHVPINQKRFTSSTVMRRSRRVHEEPKVASHASPCSQPFSAPNKLTVWQKSLLFNGRGYTVYDNSTGGLIFRVDNYASDWRIEMFLMDSTGNVLFTIKRSRKVNQSSQTLLSYPNSVCR